MHSIALHVPCVHVDERSIRIRCSSTSFHKRVVPTARISFLHLSCAPTDGIALHDCFHLSMYLSCHPPLASCWLFHNGARSVPPPSPPGGSETHNRFVGYGCRRHPSVSFRHEDRSRRSSSRRWPSRLRHALSWPRRRSEMHAFLSWRREQVLGVVVFAVHRQVRRKAHRGGRRT